MYLKSIEISGFKSFAKKVELDFTSKVSAIVGPNGSGKSNIAEAFRFVLGEQSMKSLRGKRGEDLIWNGSNEVPRSGVAKVKAVFDNTSRFLSLDYNEVSIERAVHRDGVNEYFLNGSPVRLKDIIELLAGAHVGASGHHIISQGEADRILNASPKDRKTMIEEALGLKVYQYKKTESLKKLEKTGENIGQVESLRREIAPHIKFLKRQVEKMEKAAEMKQELLLIAKEYFARENQYVQQTKASIASEKAPLEGKLEAAKKQTADAKALLAKGVTDGRSDDLMKLETDMRRARDAKNEKERARGQIEGELAAAARLIKKQEDLSKSTQWKTVEMQAVEDLRTEILTYVDTIERSSDPAEIKKAVEAIRALFKAFVDMRRDTAGADSGLIRESQAEVERLSTERTNIEREIEQLIVEEKKIETSYKKVRADIESEKETNREAEKRLFQSMSEEQSLAAELHEVRAREDMLSLVEADYKRDLGEFAILLGRELLAFESESVPETSREAQRDTRQKMEKIKIRLEDAGIGAADDVFKEYTEATERDQFLERELTDLKQSADSLANLIEELEGKISEEFETGIHKINREFHHFFTLMFGGGEASLSVLKATKKKPKNGLDELTEDAEAVPEEEEEESGIEINVSLPRKKVKGLIQLSGGERALTSIALLFAISQVNPPPFIILDETDAALDEANSKKYGDMIENLSKYSQLIVITHNRETMSRAGALYGVTMGSGGVSKLLTVAFEEAVAVAK